MKWLKPVLNWLLNFVKFNWFKNLKISYKLIISFLLLAFLMVAVGSYSIISLSSIDTNLKLLNENYSASQVNLNTILIELQKQRVYYMEAADMENEDKAAEYANLIKESDTLMTQLVADYSISRTSDEQKTQSGEMFEKINTYRGLRGDIMDDVLHGDYQDAKDLMRSDSSQKIVNDAVDITQEVIQSMALLSHDVQSSQSDSIGTMKISMIATLSAALLIAILLSLFLARGISRPLVKMAEAADKLAAGDTDFQFKGSNSKDEIGRLSATFISVVTSINALISDANMLREAALAGELSVRADAEVHQGSYRKIIEGVNLTLDAVTEPLNVAAEQINEMANGQDPDEIDVDAYAGDFKVIVENLNLLKSSLHGLVEDAQMLSIAAKAQKFDTRADAERHMGQYRDIIQGVNDTLDTVVDKTFWYESLLDAIPLPISVTDLDMNWTFLNHATEDMVGAKRSEMIGQQCSNWKTSICGTDDCAICRLRIGENQTSFEQNNKDYQADGSVILNLKGETTGYIEVIQDMTKTTRSANYINAEVERLHHNLQLLAEGQLDLEFVVAEADEYTIQDKETFESINENFQMVVEALGTYIRETAEALGQIAEGDISGGIESEFKGEFAKFKESINLILESLNSIVGDMNSASVQVASGARQVSEGDQAISQGATEQASSIEELTASIAQIAEQTKQNALNADNANELATEAKVDAMQGNDQMQGMLQSMEEINEASANIFKIIKVIDDIAFQTNILALNAAVEAARAGVHGKGFAVVAEEVRNLAARSANAAKETEELIEGSIKKAEAGTKIADKTAQSLANIVKVVEKAANLVGDIAISSNEQATGIAQINKGIEQMSQVVQANSATAEQSAAASEELSEQAGLLNEMVGKFKLKGSNREEEQADYTGDKLRNKSGGRETGKGTKTQKDEGTKKYKPQIILSDDDYGKY